jgi:hypothetical protein
MAITQAVCNSFKQEILQAVHNFSSAGGNTFKLSLYSSAAVLNSATTSYLTSGEVSASGQYTAGGGVLAGQQTSLDTGVGIVTFSNLSFTGVTLTAAGALIYNSSATNKAVCALDFGGDKTATAGTFTIVFPAFTSSAAILRIA